MENKNNFLVKMDLSSMPSDIIYNISKYLVDSPVLDMCVKYPRKRAYLLYFFFGKNIPKDAEQYNEMLEDEDKYYKVHDFTPHFKENLSGILGMIKQKHKQQQLRTYEITFDAVHYNNHSEEYINDYSLYTFSIYNNKKMKCLKLHEHGITQITYNEDSETHSCMSYKKKEFNSMEEQFIINTLNNIEKDIKYYIKRCLTYKRLRTELYIKYL